MARPLLHLIDGSGYIFRAYYAIRALSTADGTPTNAIYGFTTMIEKALRDESPTHLAIVFDKGGPQFRKDLYPEYKANRSAPPEDLTPQIPRIHDVARAWKIPEFIEPRVEADDVIATLTRRALEEGYDVCLITGDKDLMQLVNDRVSLFEPMRNQRFGPAEVEKKMGVPPAQLGDSLALSGDSSDNIPGVRGVGPKKAAKLLADYGDLETVLQAAADKKVKGKLGESLVDEADNARLSRKLVELESHVELELQSIDDLKYGGPDKAALREIYVELEFRRLIPKLDVDAPESETQVDDTPSRPVLGLKVDPAKSRSVTDEADLNKVVAAVKKAKEVAVVVELSSFHTVDCDLFGVGLAFGKDEAVYIPVGSVHGGDYLDEKTVLAAVGPILEDASIAKVSPEAKLVLGAFSRRGIKLRNLTFDTTLASYLLEPDETQHNPAAVAKRIFGYVANERAPLLKTEKRRRQTFDKAALEGATAHVAERAAITKASREALAAALEQADLQGVLLDVELPLVPILSQMEQHGVRIDLERLSDMKVRFADALERLQKECFDAAGQEFNLGSPKQLQKVLFEDLGLKIVKRGKTGPSTDQSVLEALAGSHPLPASVLEYRQLEKLKSTYIDALPKLVSEETGRVHTVFNQATAATGRISSTDPNLQNIPIRTEIGRELRKVFVAAEGNKLISVDYSQVELRVLAHFCQDEVLVKAFRDGADVHTRTAAALFEIPEDEVSREQRTQAKAVNFGVLYGMGPVRLARDLKIPRRVASQFVKDYFTKQPGVRRFVDETLENAKASKEVRTLLGRRRLVPELHSRNRGARAAAERIAVNTPIQGSAADLIKLAMVRVANVLDEKFPETKLLLQVHDELLLEAPETKADDVAAMVRELMEGIFPLEVPLVAQAHVGSTWHEAH